MKKLFVLAAFLFMGLGVNAQSAIDGYFEKYEDNSDFATVYVSPKMFSMISKSSSRDVKDLEVLKTLRGLTVLSTQSNGLQYYSEAQSIIPTGSFDELVRVKDRGQNVNIYAKSSGSNTVSEVLLLVGDSNNFTLVSFIGNIKLEDLNKLAHQLDIKGAEHLDKVQ